MKIYKIKNFTKAKNKSKNKNIFILILKFKQLVIDNFIII